MRVLSAIDEKIMRQLAHFKFLTLSQLIKLQTGEKSYVSSRMKILRDDGFIGASQYGGIYKSGEGGRVENIHYLLPKGARFLAENISELSLENIHYPKNIDGIFHNDYFHRISTINTRIAFELWAKQQGFEPLFTHTYFHKVGSAKRSNVNDALKSITRVIFGDGSFIEPDITIAYSTGQKRQLLVIEVSNGKDTTRIVEQIKKLAGAISQGLITKMYQTEYDIQVSPRLLCTIETTDMLRLVLKRISNDPYFTASWMKQAFLFQIADSVWDSFGSGWVNIENIPKTLGDL